ncbi:MAG TPA: hypothetical protein PLQ35_09805 [bacterium]|nr:hypothetical protein [bacterium]HQL62577.1 hypothetical protein [bacterium]
MNAASRKDNRLGSASNAVLFRAAGFTFPEVLAAMVLAATVIPVTLKGIRIANGVSVLAERQSIAVRLAEQYLNELSVTRQWQYSSAKGNFGSEWADYRWALLKQPWTDDNFYLLTLIVYFPVQGREQNVRLSTLVVAEVSS